MTAQQTFKPFDKKSIGSFKKTQLDKDFESLLCEFTKYIIYVESLQRSDVNGITNVFLALGLYC